MKLWLKACWNCLKSFLTNDLFLFFAFIVAAFGVITLIAKFPKVVIPIAFWLAVIAVVFLVGFIIFLTLFEINNEHERLVEDNDPYHILMDLRQRRGELTKAIYDKNQEISDLKNKRTEINDKIDALRKELNDDEN